MNYKTEWYIGKLMTVLRPKEIAFLYGSVDKPVLIVSNLIEVTGVLFWEKASWLKRDNFYVDVWVLKSQAKAVNKHFKIWSHLIEVKANFVE